MGLPPHQRPGQEAPHVACSGNRTGGGGERVIPADLLAKLLVLAFVGLEHLLAIARHRGILAAQRLDFALQLGDLAGLALHPLEPLVLRVDLALVDRHPFLVDALAVHQGIGGDLGLIGGLQGLAGGLSGIEHPHGASDNRNPADAEEDHPLAALGLVIVDDRAGLIDRVLIVALGAIEVLGPALEKIHGAYLSAGTTT